MSLLTKEELQNFLDKADLKLKPRQPRVCLPIIQRIHRKMTLNVPFDEIQADENNLLVDGHHRYISSEILTTEIGVKKGTNNDSATNLEWSNVVIDDTDWDTAEQIQEFNNRDAKRSGLDINIFNRTEKEEVN